MPPDLHFLRRTVGEIALLGRLPGDAEAPRNPIIGFDPCPTCLRNMERGVTLLVMSPTRSIRSPR